MHFQPHVFLHPNPLTPPFSTLNSSFFFFNLHSHSTTTALHHFNSIALHYFSIFMQFVLKTVNLATKFIHHKQFLNSSLSHIIIIKNIIHFFYTILSILIHKNNSFYIILSINSDCIFIQFFPLIMIVVENFENFERSPLL